MKKINKFLILAAALSLFLVNIAHALAFDVKITSIKDKIILNESAEFNVAIQNYMDTDEEFTIKKTGYPFWDMYAKPLQNPITLNVPSNGTSSIKLFVDPLHITTVDTYNLDVGVVLGRTGEERKVPITIGIKSTASLIGEYKPTVLGSLGISPEKIDPRNELTVKITLNNQNIIDYKNLTIKIDSNLFKDELYTPLGPQEEKTIEVTKKLDDMTTPQQDKVTVTVLKAQRVIVSPMIKEFEIKEYTVQEDIPEEKSFLKIRKGVKVMSNNPDYKAIIKIETTQFKNLLLTTSPKADTIKENNQNYLIWEVVLDQDRTVEVYATENYRPILVIAVLLIIIIILYFVFRSPIIVRKSIANVVIKEGGVSEAKVIVRVKNRSSKQIANIEVLDNVPHIAHVEKELSIGSMQPHAVLKHPKKGIMIRWIIETLESGDERVLSYRMKSTLAILGEFNLPAANARCKLGNRLIISNSNRVSVGG